MQTQPANLKTLERRWHVIDADGLVLGRVATRAARLLMGKHRPTYTTFLDTGDHVVVVNAARVKLTGRKEEQKIYKNYSGYPGGLKERSASVIREKNPERIIEQAVKGMLPRNKQSRSIIKRLKVYAGGEHPHVAQKPQVLEV